MIDSLVTGLPDGAIPLAVGSEGDGNQERSACDQVTLTIVITYANKETGRVVATFTLDSPYWVDGHDLASARWSLALPRYEMMHLLCTYLQSKFLKVVVRREELLSDS